MSRNVILCLLACIVIGAATAVVASDSDLNDDGVVEEASSPQLFPPCPPGTPANAADKIIAVGYTGPSSPSYHIDPSTGQGVFLGESGFRNLNSLARDGMGEVYTIQGGAPPFAMATIDPDTGVGTLVTYVSFGSITPRIRGIAFSPEGDLLAIHNPGTGAGVDELYLVDVETGEGTLIGSTTFEGVQGLAFAPSGTLYAWDIFEGLLIVDPETGFATDVTPEAGTQEIQSIVFGPEGKLYGARDELFEIDPQTGMVCVIGSGGYVDVRGIEYLGLCGNGVLDEGEQCDDGNNFDGDGCAGDCTEEQDVPATSNRMMIVTALLLLLVGSVLILRGRAGSGVPTGR